MHAPTTPPSAAHRYHERTKHSPASVRADRFTLDFPNQPRPYKLYTSLSALPLPRDLPSLEVPAFGAIAGSPAPDPQRQPDLTSLARLCLLSNGITKHLRTPGGPMAFRAAPCTGALYHIELYVVCGDLSDLPAGVYHYGAHDHALRRLRAGDFRAALVQATGDEPSVAHAPAILVSTSTFWRNAWKYRARAYRHAYWDDGVVLSHLLAVAAAERFPARVVLGFADEPVNQLLDIDGRHEAAVSLLAVGTDATPSPASPRLTRLSLPVEPLSQHEVEYPDILDAHAATSLTSGSEARAWRANAPTPLETPPLSALTLLPTHSSAALPVDPIDAVIRRRGSTRRFSGEPIPAADLGTLLGAALAPIPADFLSPSAPTLCQPYLVVNAVDGLPAGAYAVTASQGGIAVELLRAGNFQQHAGALALGQALGAEAAVNVYFLANLDQVLARFGERGYRAVQLEAAMRAGRLYLGAYALHLGATGLTFFDDAVTDFFSPHAAGKSVLFLLALGHPLRRA